MSRRESRVSIGVRQNDSLAEFENFKKKFLLANKHITKLNSTLSVRIEELNAQISMLYVENLRLRASEIALATQLQREKEKSWKVMADAEAATHNLSKHLAHIRKSFNISPTRPLPAQSSVAPQSRTKRPMPDPAASPQTSRLSRAPNVPGIYEEDEGEESSSPEDERTPSPTVRRKTKGRLSASRLPLPSRVSPSPPPVPSSSTLIPEQPLAPMTKKKPGRRQSGLLTVDTTRPPSPAYGSPIQRDAALVQEDEDEEMALTDEMNVDAELDAALRREKKKVKSGKPREDDADDVILIENNRTRDRDMKRRRDDDESSSTTATEGGKKLKDVTNSPRARGALPALDTNVPDRERQGMSEPEPNTAVSAATTSSLPYVSNQTTPATTPAVTPHPSHSSHGRDYLPTPRPSSSPVPTGDASDSETGANATGVRATRTRKSVNYAEPKLNTKMRKPDSEPGTSVGTKKRLSGITKLQQQLPIVEDSNPMHSTAGSTPPASKKRSSTAHSSKPPLPPLPIDSEPEPRLLFETNSRPTSRNHVQPLEIKSRPATAPPPAPESPPLQPLPPRPSSRPASSSSFRPISSSHAFVTTTPLLHSSATSSAKRKKSRPYIDPDEFDDSDGTQADGEFMGSSTWINVEGRRKSNLHSHSGTSSVKDRRAEGDDGRRHSMAV